MRAMGTATVTFGMVSIPVKVYSAAASEATVRFRALHQECSTPIKQKNTCPACEIDLEWSEVVKGYEHTKGQFVTFTDDEIKAMQADATKTIAIEEFVPIAKIDPLYYDKSYYLGPDKGGDGPYSLLAQAMRKTDRAGIGQYSVRGKEHLVLIRPTDAGLVLHQLVYARDLREQPAIAAEVRPAELDLAVQFIEARSNAAFEPEGYADSVRDRMLAAIAEKVESGTFTVPEAESPKAQITDVMEALKASLAATAPRTKKAPAKKAKKRSTRKKAG